MLPSPATQLLNIGSADLAQRRSDEIEEIERQKRLAARAAALSPAGSAVFGPLSLGMQ
jgi:hypothetical protein